MLKPKADHSSPAMSIAIWPYQTLCRTCFSQTSPMSVGRTDAHAVATALPMRLANHCDTRSELEVQCQVARSGAGVSPSKFSSDRLLITMSPQKQASLISSHHHHGHNACLTLGPCINHQLCQEATSKHRNATSRSTPHKQRFWHAQNMVMLGSSLASHPVQKRRRWSWRRLFCHGPKLLLTVTLYSVDRDKKTLAL